MPAFFKSWGLDGSLKVTDFSSLQSNGIIGSPSNIHGFGEIGGVYCERVVKDGYQCVKMNVTPSDLITANGHRTELIPATATASGVTDFVGIADWTGQENTERWYRFSFMLPEFDTSWLNSGFSTWLVITQLHQDPDDTPADVVASPPIAFEIKDNKIVVTNFTCTDTITTNANRAYRELYSTPLQFNKWYDFVVNVKWSWTNRGKVRIWSDRKQVYHDIAAVNCANNDPSRGSNGNYAKIGIYTHYPMNDYYNKPLVIYHRGMIVGNESCSFSDMFPESTTTVYPINPTILDSNISYIG